MSLPTMQLGDYIPLWLGRVCCLNEAKTFKMLYCTFSVWERMYMYNQGSKIIIVSLGKPSSISKLG
jgi:hypothetical protein